MSTTTPKVRYFALFVSFALLATLFVDAPDPVYANGATTRFVAPSAGTPAVGSSCTDPDFAGNTHASIQGAITAASNGDTIYICAGTYAINTTLQLGAKTITLQGAGAGSTILDGGGTTQILTGDTVTVSGLAFQSGSALLGGAIRANGSATITDSTFTGNTADPGQGGGAIVAFGSATISGSTFTNNSAGIGGAFYTNGTATVTASTFTANIAVNRGGAFYSGGTATVTDSTFTGNDAPEGDDVYAQNGGTVCANPRGAAAAGFMGVGTPGIWDDACPPLVGPDPTRYTLSVTTPRFGVITTTDGFSCAQTDVSCALVAREGRTVTFSSSVLSGHTFIRWNGCTSVSVGGCSVTLGADTTISASYGSRWLTRFVVTSSTLRASSATTVSAAATALGSIGTGDTITITGYAKTAGATALARAKALRRALRAAGVSAPITITTAASGATSGKHAKAEIIVVWGVTP